MNDRPEDKLQIVRDLFDALDNASDPIAAHVIKQTIERQPRKLIDIIIGERIGEPL